MTIAYNHRMPHVQMPIYWISKEQINVPPQTCELGAADWTAVEEEVSPTNGQWGSLLANYRLDPKHLKVKAIRAFCNQTEQLHHPLLKLRLGFSCNMHDLKDQSPNIPAAPFYLRISISSFSAYLCQFFFWRE